MHVTGGGGVARANGGAKFWEGGKGCRNKSLLNRNDQHKYSNSKDKTLSKKGERVGVNGKKNIQKEQQQKVEAEVASRLLHRCG